jgi:hypothetical protein
LWRASVIVPWAAAATFAIVAGYESVQTGPKSAAAPLALAPVTVRPASRGEDAVVAPGPGGALTLAVALAGVDDSSVQYDLRRGDQRLASGEARHAAGAPLLLMIPPGLLQSGDRCVLTVKSAGTADLTVEEYRFRVESR